MWDTQIDSLIENACYKMDGISVREFNSVKSLSAGMFVEVENIGEIQEPDSEDELESTGVVPK